MLGSILREIKKNENKREEKNNHVTEAYAREKGKNHRVDGSREEEMMSRQCEQLLLPPDGTDYDKDS